MRIRGGPWPFAAMVLQLCADLAELILSRGLTGEGGGCADIFVSPSSHPAGRTVARIKALALVVFGSRSEPSFGQRGSQGPERYSGFQINRSASWATIAAPVLGCC